ncbi:DUF4082 domain-containing protein [Actinoplanes italicus]|nr:DUF4082 domain-containing protein [Actinoplanes italicus]
MSTGVWTRSNSVSFTITPMAITGLGLGDWVSGVARLVGDMECAAAWTRALSDDEVSTLAASLGAWLCTGPAGFWVLDQAAVSIPVRDWTGGGANQVSTVGTSVSANSVPIGYGHPIGPPTRASGAEHLFRNQTPAVINASDGTPGITVATTMRFAADGQVTAIRWFATTTVSGVYTVALWSVDTSDPGTGTLLASATMGSAPNPGTWNTVPIGPVSVTAGTAYRASVFSGDGRYVATTSFFGSDLVNGNITADADGDTVAGKTISQGTFRINASAGYPNSPGSQTNYFVDVDYTAGAGGPVTHNADATLAATGTLSGAATRDTSTTATLAANGTLTGTATKTTSGTAALAATGTLAATGVRTQDATATLAATGGLSGTGLRTTDTTATLAATGALTGTAARTQATTAALAGLGELTATGTTGGDQTATLTATGSLTAAGERTAATTGTLSATGALTATGTTTRLGTAVLSATGTLTAAGDVTPPGVETATLSGTGALSATAVRTAVDTGLLAAVGALTGTVARATSAMATLAGLGSLTATAIIVPPDGATSAPTSALRTTTRPTVLATVSRPLVLRTGRPPT